MTKVTKTTRMTKMGNIRKFLIRVSTPNIDYQPLIEVRVFKDSLLHNLKEFQAKFPNLQFAPVLKSNAYGHGLVQAAEILDKQDLPFFMVDSFYEALVLRRAGIKTKILVLGYVREDQLTSGQLKDVSFGIIDLKILKALASKLHQMINIHLKIDTGMHRQGILIDEIPQAVEIIRTNKYINIEGLCTHFADADGPEDQFTLGQIEKWNQAVMEFKKYFPGIKYFHASNSAGTSFAQKIEANVSRLGIGLYGINFPPKHQLNLKPALEMVSIISSIKHIKAGEKVGYGITFTAPRDVIVATVPVGYNEGVDRRLSNKGCFIVKEVECPLVGRVSMNMSSIDVSNVPDVKIEDEVKIISANPSDKNSVENMAKLAECITHEILVHTPNHLRRVVV